MCTVRVRSAAYTLCYSNAQGERGRRTDIALGPLRAPNWGWCRGWGRVPSIPFGTWSIIGGTFVGGGSPEGPVVVAVVAAAAAAGRHQNFHSAHLSSHSSCVAYYVLVLYCAWPSIILLLCFYCVGMVEQYITDEGRRRALFIIHHWNLACAAASPEVRWESHFLRKQGRNHVLSKVI